MIERGVVDIAAVKQANADLARLTGVSPKIVSTAIWTIAGFLSTVSVILYATAQGSAAVCSRCNLPSPGSTAVGFR